MRVARFSAIWMLTALAGFAAAAHERPAPATSGAVTAPTPALVNHNVAVSRGVIEHVDDRVLANLLAPVNERMPLTVVTGEVTRCESDTCHVPMLVRMAENAIGPVRLSFAVANAKGQLSDVLHADCGTGECMVDLIVERGRNTLSIGAVDGLAHTAGFATLTVNAQRQPVAAKGKSEWF
jgi:hypothetical protein